jgi:hypothetical protein
MVLRILSAEHGLLKPDTKIVEYDRRMTQDRAQELRDEVIQEIAEIVTHEDVARIVINAGADYRPAVTGLETAIADRVEVYYIPGMGIGEKGSKLKSLIRSDTKTKPAISS